MTLWSTIWHWGATPCNRAWLLWCIIDCLWLCLSFWCSIDENHRYVEMVYSVCYLLIKTMSCSTTHFKMEQMGLLVMLIYIMECTICISVFWTIFYYLADYLHEPVSVCMLYKIRVQSMYLINWTPEYMSNCFGQIISNFRIQVDLIEKSRELGGEGCLWFRWWPKGLISGHNSIL